MIKSFVILLLTTLIFLSSFGYVAYRLQEADFIVEQSRSVNLYGRLISNASSLLPSEQRASFGLASNDVTDILKSAIDGDQFYAFERSALAAYLPWLTGKTDALTFVYPLQEVKQKIADATSAKILTKYNNLPDCTSAELRGWEFENKLPSCQLAAGTLKSKSLKNLADQTALKLTEGIPDSLSVSQPTTSLLAVRENAALVSRIIYAIWGGTVSLLLLYLLIFRGAGLVSLAVCFLLVGLLQISFSLVGWDWLTKTIGDVIGGFGKARSIVPVIIDLVSVILGAMKTVMGNISLGFLVSGGGLLTAGTVSKINRAVITAKNAK